jgi:superfamily II DNA or RNA helicase
MTTLRPYQTQGIDELRSAFSAGARSALYVLPTGGGKTTIFVDVARRALERGKRVCVLAHRRELVEQASRRLDAFEIPHGIIAAGKRVHVPVCSRSGIAVASVQTLVRREVDAFDLLVVDEAHHAPAGSWGKIIERMPSARVLGVTATPCRLDGKGLASTFEKMILGPNYSELIAGGFLTDADVFAPTRPDMTGTKRRAGDYAAEEIDAAVNRPTITGSAVEHYLRLAMGKRAVAFCASVAHAEAVAEAFRYAGVPSACLHGKLDSDVRAARLAELERGELLVLTACDIVSEGFDLPALDVAILLRPTCSLGLYLQQVGRVLRPFVGKIRALVLDHVGNVFRHGFPTEDRFWSLSEGAVHRAPSTDDEAAFLIRQCPACFAVHRPSQVCVSCGHVYETRDKAPEFSEVVLQAITRRDAENRKQDEAERKQRAAEFRKKGWRAESIGELIELARDAGFDNPSGTAWQYAKWMATKGRHVR